MPTAIDLSLFVKHHDDGTACMDLAVDGMTCAACIGDIESALRRLPGLIRARVNYTSHRLSVDWTEDALDPALLIDNLARLGFRAYPFASNHAEDAEARQAHWLLRCLAIAGFAAMNIMLLSVAIWAGNANDITSTTRDLFHWLSALIVLPAASFAGQPFFLSALRALRGRNLNMDVPISLGIILALTMSLIETAQHAEHAYFDSAIMLIFFLLIGRYCDCAMRRKTRSVAANLAALRAPTASRLCEKDEITIVPVAALARGNLVLVKPGERVPADGTLISGSSEIDESLVTGETAHRLVKAGDEIYAGTLNYSGTLRLLVRAAAGNSLLDEIEQLIEAAVTAKSHYRRLADRVSRLYAPVVHLTAAATAIGWLIVGASTHDAIVTAIAVLIITCPCALALAVPAVQVVASGALFQSGILLNASDAIERLAAIDTIVFDKTGTLTLPDPSVTNAGSIGPHLLQSAARLALSSRHPLATALAAQALSRKAFDQVEETSGAGVTAMIDGVEARLGRPDFCGLENEAYAARASDPEASLLGFRHGDTKAIFMVRQSLRTDAKATISALQSRGLKVMILSGDRSQAVEAAARTLGVSDWRAETKPAEKIAVLDALKGRGCRVLMVGDGMNDAPALAAAHVSLSPISAADLAQASADALFLGEKLAPVCEALEICRKAHAIMQQNLGLALVYNLVAVPLAISGQLTPLIAAAAMSGSSIIVTLNALRAGRSRGSDKAAVMERRPEADASIAEMQA
jgi:Cu2+-exporting ATPase